MMSVIFIYYIGGSGLAGNRRCNLNLFESRRALFSTGTNFLIVPGDNEWNECYDYDITSNTSPMREVWRDLFARNDAFTAFSRDFPGGGRPTIQRKTTPNAFGDSNPEIFFFKREGIIFFGLNQVSRNSYIGNNANNGYDINAEWVEEQLAANGCSINSIVLVSQTFPSQGEIGSFPNFDNSAVIKV